MEELPTERSIYFHTLIFNKNIGVSSIWGYMPNPKALLGYIQHSFLQEAFYKWIHGNQKLVTKIPSLPVQIIIKEAEKLKKINKDIAIKMKHDYDKLNNLWNSPISKLDLEVKKFVKEFNGRWRGDNKQFLYLKIFRNARELGDFVISSGLITNTEKELEKKIGVPLEKWKDICEDVVKDKDNGEKFRNVLLKRLTEVF
ncbi:hypothetical protein [Clostridium taeniosporum]|uniref:Uncharacterized protein n=1 Tax=Clostridium taeniosporum TaxID=394958 RepID=A0A1D7XGM0_9CLOT|nr:hypothetical protein [Clostridium taeniosporum]AOR22497.2 hypothetical protein BGI42_01575 [Clostridium taeniosporum]